jgi:hypothetical protein
VEILKAPPTREQKGPRVQYSIRPIALGDSADLVGYSFRGRGPIAPGTVYDATLSYRSRKRQAGRFGVKIELLNNGKPVGERRVEVRTQREPVQRYLLEKDEAFWAVAEVQIPLGLNAQNVEMLATLEAGDPLAGEPEPVPPPLRLGP